MKNKIHPFTFAGLEIKNDENSFNLNPSLNLENFITGQCNLLAYSAGMKIIKNIKNSNFNPLFIYGSTGLGKTHLINGIGLKIKQNYPNLNIFYINSIDFENFCNKKIMDGNKNDIFIFFNKIDVFIIDDLDFLHCIKTQDLLFYLINKLLTNKKQIIIASNKFFNNLKQIDNRLLSRFKLGLSIEILKPDNLTLINIIKTKFCAQGYNIDDAAIKYMSQFIFKDIREISGFINTIILESKLNLIEINYSFLHKKLHQLEYKKKEYEIYEIKKIICDYKKIKIKDLETRTRKREITEARHLCMYWAKELTKIKLESIAFNVAKRDHSTCLHSIKVVNNLKETDKQFKKEFEDIEKIFIP